MERILKSTREQWRIATTSRIIKSKLAVYAISSCRAGNSCRCCVWRTSDTWSTSCQHNILLHTVSRVPINFVPRGPESAEEWSHIGCTICNQSRSAESCTIILLRWLQHLAILAPWSSFMLVVLPSPFICRKEQTIWLHTLCGWHSVVWLWITWKSLAVTTFY